MFGIAWIGIRLEFDYPTLGVDIDLEETMQWIRIGVHFVDLSDHRRSIDATFSTRLQRLYFLGLNARLGSMPTSRSGRLHGDLRVAKGIVRKDVRLFSFTEIQESLADSVDVILR